eukprot:6451762-Amphidinium_carterae.1
MTISERAYTLVWNLLDGVLGPLTDTEYIAAGKELHNIVKVSRSWGAERLDNATLAEVIYLHSLAGRGRWPPKTTVQEQVDLRRTSVEAFVADEGVGSEDQRVGEGEKWWDEEVVCGVKAHFGALQVLVVSKDGGQARVAQVKETKTNKQQLQLVLQGGGKEDLSAVMGWAERIAKGEASVDDILLEKA